MKKRFLAALLLFLLVVPQGRNLRSDWNECREAREHLTRSGTARDAKESLWGGKVKPKEPRSEFSSDDEKITWWGEFKPFETWHRLEADVQWIDPHGRVAKRERVPGGKCRMMKASLSPRELPFRMVDGVWTIAVGCPGESIDVKQFMIRGSIPVEGGVVLPASSAPVYREIVVEKRK
jgi:hypothetical protein